MLIHSLASLHPSCRRSRFQNKVAGRVGRCVATTVETSSPSTIVELSVLPPFRDDDRLPLDPLALLLRGGACAAVAVVVELLLLLLVCCALPMTTGGTAGVTMLASCC